MREFRLSLSIHVFTDVTSCPDVSLVQRDFTYLQIFFAKEINMRAKYLHRTAITRC